MSILQTFERMLAVIAVVEIFVAQSIPVLEPPLGKFNRFYAKTYANINVQRQQQRQKRIFDIILEANFRVNSKPEAPGSVQRNEELFQGDIVMTDVIRNAIREGGTDSIALPSTGRKRAVTSNSVAKWPSINGVVKIPYTIEQSSIPDQSVILQAMSHWTQKVPCVTFVNRTNQKNYISFFVGQGCYSWTGRTGGKQRISIGKGCAVMGVIAHEIGHALGFWHEQSRPDRDNYVKILWNNVQPGAYNSFKKIVNGGTNDLGVPYDLNSLMHYGPTAFAKSPGLNTIIKLDGNTDFGLGNELSDKDVQQAKLLYCQGSKGCKYKDSTAVQQYCPAWKRYGFCDKTSIYHHYMVAFCKRTCLC